MLGSCLGISRSLPVAMNSGSRQNAPEGDRSRLLGTRWCLGWSSPRACTTKKRPPCDEHGGRRGHGLVSGLANFAGAELGLCFQVCTGAVVLTLSRSPVEPPTRFSVGHAFVSAYLTFHQAQMGVNQLHGSFHGVFSFKIEF